MAASVVNLLDMRDDEEDRARSASPNPGGRWKARNANKAGDTKKKRHRGAGPRASTKGEGSDKRASGFVGNRTLSNVSGMSDFFDAEGEEGDDDKGKDKKNTLLSKLAGQGDGAPEGVPEDIEGGGQVFEEARKIAKLRQLCRGESPASKGPFFSQSVWEFYMVKAYWSDGLCVALNHQKMYPTCFIPCCWPIRLCQTISRSQPIKARLCCINCSLKGCSAVPVIAIIFSFPLLAGLLFMVRDQIWDLFKRVPVLKEDENYVLYLIILAIFFGIMTTAYFWIRILLGIATKYRILQAMDKPSSFMWRGICCVIALNTRVGLHVDRAQGFEKVLRTDQNMVELSDQIRLSAPVPHAMV